MRRWAPKIYQDIPSKAASTTELPTMNNRLYQSLYQSIPVLPVYTSLYRVHLAARITSVFTLTRPARDAVKLGIPYCIHAPIHTPPRNRTARATRPRKRVPTCVSRPLGGGGAPPPPRKRLEGRLTERDAHGAPGLLFQNFKRSATFGPDHS